MQKALDDAEKALPGGYIKMSGRYRFNAGINKDQDFVLNDANPPLQERDFNYLFGEELENTFDHGIYNQHLVNIDFSPRDKVNLYTQIVNDPWSLVGTTGEQILTSTIGGESLRYNLKYFGASNRTLGEIYRTNNTDSVAFPQVKVHDGRLTPGTVLHGFFEYNPATGGIPFNLPEHDIDFEYRPFRKLWLDYTEDEWHARVFALADETQALTTDDPLVLSNRRDYWQQSPWLYDYKPVKFFTDGSISRGFYDDTISFFARDTEGNRLVLLRGAALEGQWDDTYFAGTVAAPYTPWDEDYFDSNNVPGAFRLKHDVDEKLMVGGVYTFRNGLVDDGIADSSNVIAADFKYAVTPTSAFTGEIAHSNRDLDLQTDDRLKETHHGNAYKIAWDLNEDHPTDGHRDLHVSYTQMDRHFDPVLSRYTNTRDDHFWSNHLTFGEYTPDMEYFRIGDGIDKNRIVLRARWKEKMFADRFQNLIDVRNVHKQHNTAYVETVVRDEITYRFNDKLTAKGLFRWHGFPSTTPYVDPFLANFYFIGREDPSNLRHVNTAVPADADADRYTYSAGLQYILNKEWTLEGFFERTNDIPDFPRGLMNSVFRDSTSRVEGILIDRLGIALYDQNRLGAVPPYEYFNIFRERIIYRPEPWLKFIFHAAQNGYDAAAGIDDNITHQGVSMEVECSKKFTVFMDYTHSRVLDVPQAISSGWNIQDVRDHHNFYASMDYKLNSSTVFRSEYGVYGMGLNTPLVTPYSTTTFSLPTLNTEHLFRVSLTGEF